MNASLRKYVLILGLILLQSACSSLRLLDLNEIQLLSENEVIGTYNGRMRGDQITIHLKEEGAFKYEFSHSISRGYIVGSYGLEGSLIKLSADSVVSENLMDIIEGNKIVKRRSVDNIEYEYAVSEEGLHEKNSEGNYWKVPSLSRKVKDDH